MFGRVRYLAVGTAGLLLLPLPFAHAQQVVLTRDYDLVAEIGLRPRSQVDSRWAYFPVGRNRDVDIAECGCLLAVFSTILDNEPLGLLPWFPTAYNYFGGSAGAFDFNPRYLDQYLYLGRSPTGAPPAPGGLSFPPGWGYKPGLPLGTCGVIPLVQGLETIGRDAFFAPGGITTKVREDVGLPPATRDIINRNLIAGRPTIVGVRRGDSNTANHAMLIAGWDHAEQKYTVLDPQYPARDINGWRSPAIPSWLAPGETLGEDEPSYEKWVARIEGIIEIRPAGIPSSTPSFLFGDDPSPIEIVMTGPDGRRTGFDPAIPAAFDEHEAASYWTFGPWSDPRQALPSSAAPRFIMYSNAPSGRYYFKVTGVADGPLTLTAETLFGGTLDVLATYDDAIAAGEVRKYQLDFSRSATSSVAEVANFTPRAVAGPDVAGRTDLAIPFAATQSFDADDGIVSYDWDFGDGGTGSGELTQHVYLAPGDYTVTLTVTDAAGASDSDTLIARVILSQRRPVAQLTGPYLGFASPTDDRFAVFLDARGSSDPNGDILTYRWNFGDGSPEQSTVDPYTLHAYETPGLYTVTLVVNDSSEDSEPAISTVEVNEAPTSWPVGPISGTLTPTCGSSGDTVTITIGEFVQFYSWDFGTGRLPTFPPAYLPVGLVAPAGLHRVQGPGDSNQLLPFTADLTAPGRYVARVSFTVPDGLAPDRYTVRFGEDLSASFDVPCPVPANRAPLADAGGPYSGNVGAIVTFDGSRSSDPDGDSLSYEWHFGDGEIGSGVNPQHTYANAGEYDVTLIVSDGSLSSIAHSDAASFAQALIAGEPPLDVTPPVTMATISPPANASGWHTGNVSVALAAEDEPGGSGVRDIEWMLSGAQSGNATVPGDQTLIEITAEGTSSLGFRAADNAGNLEAPQLSTIRIDRTGPTLLGLPAAGCTLWPPNHTLVTVARVSAFDTGAGLLPNSLQLSVTSSEPANANGDGSTAPDYVIDGGVVSLRAERAGPGVSRTYTITAVATDLAGNVSRAESTCVVPHDRRR